MHSRRDFLLGMAALANVGLLEPMSKVHAESSAIPSFTDAPVEDGSLFPSNLAPFQWQKFKAAGYAAPTTGIIYRTMRSYWYTQNVKPRPVSGMPLGGIDTGGLYLEGSGSFGYSSIFNNYVPPGGPLNAPFLGISIGGKVWMLNTGHRKNYAGNCPPTLGPPLSMFHEGTVTPADSIDYWGHYPIADLQYQTGAPVKVALRAWTPFIPGDSKVSNTPGAIFEIHLTNPTENRQTGTLAFNFPGFSEHMPQFQAMGWPGVARKINLPEPHIERRNAPGDLSGTWVEDKGWGMSYVLAALNEKNVRLGAGMGSDPRIWVAVEKTLPQIPSSSTEMSDGGGSSLAVDFALEPGQERVIQIVLAWYAPEWEGDGNPGTGGEPVITDHFHTYGQAGKPGTTGKRFTHMYAARFGDAGEVATYLARNRQSLLQRIVGWQSVLYNEGALPGWLADSLINSFYYFAPCSVWAQAKPPIGSWCKPEDGLFAINEAPRSCPHVSTFTNMSIGGPVLAMIFPELARSYLRSFRAAQREDGDLPQILGLWMDLATPAGYGYQEVMMGANYMDQLYWVWKATGDDDLIREFYPSVKKMLEHNFSLNPDLGPSQIISMPAPSSKWDQLEWFEDRDMSGYQAHAGGYRMAAAEMMREWARKMGDLEYDAKLATMLDAGREAMQKHLWREDHYLVFNDIRKGKAFDAFFTPQLDGQYYAHISGVPPVFPKANVDKILTVMRDKVCNLTKLGQPPVYANADATLYTGPGANPYLTGKYIYTNTQVMWIAILYIYEGYRDFGMDLLRKNLEIGYCDWGYMWDGVNCCSGSGDTGEASYGWDYWFNWSVWMAAAALADGDFSALLRPDGLVNKMIKAGSLT